ncbi:MAG: FecR family protein [Desulfobaccales bacterium]
MLMICAVMLTYATVAGAAAVGRFTLAEGRVDLLKDGNLPAVVVKVDDAVGSGDVIRTKSLSRAQITFIDNSTLTISPESRIAIEEFTFDAAQNKRSAVLKLFQGLALAVVNKIIKADEPDFVVKTHTAIMGVRGTEFGVRLSPNSSTILNFMGSTQVGNIFPEVSRLFLRAFKVAFSFGWNNGSNRWVLLKAMQGTTVGLNVPPTKPFAITREDQLQFMRQLSTNASGQGHHSRNLPQPVAASSIPAAGPPSIITPGTPSTLNLLTTVTVPPTLAPTPQAPPPTPAAPPTPTHSPSGSPSDYSTH